MKAKTLNCDVSHKGFIFICSVSGNKAEEGEKYHLVYTSHCASCFICGIGFIFTIVPRERLTALFSD